MLYILFAAATIAIAAPASATLLDFEAPLPAGLAPITSEQGSVVLDSARVTDQYLAQGVRITDAALVAPGLGHAASGENALAGIGVGGVIDYDQTITFTFFQPGSGGVPGTTTFFAYSPDLLGGSNNIITISAFAYSGELLGQKQFVESGTFFSPLSINGVGQFHRVTVDQTLFDTSSGGIAVDLVEFGNISAVPEPSAYWLIIAGLAFLGIAARRNKQLRL